MFEKIGIFLADGCEEIEAVGMIDVLRRLDFEVTTISITQNLQVTGAHKIKMEADTVMAQVKPEDFAAILLPGGMPGSLNLLKQVADFLKKSAEAGKVVGAICAAPIALEAAGLLENKHFTAYPGFEKYFNGKTPSDKLVEVDGKIITGRGPGAVFAFASAVAAAFNQNTDALYQAMFLE